MEYRCLTVQLASNDLINSCAYAADLAASKWRESGISEAQIQHVLKHPFPGIATEYVQAEQLKLIGEEAARLLGVVLIQVDGIGQGRLVNILAE